jgi:hypothetical protein
VCPKYTPTTPPKRWGHKFDKNSITRFIFQHSSHVSHQCSFFKQTFIFIAVRWNIWPINMMYIPMALVWRHRHIYHIGVHFSLWRVHSSCGRIKHWTHTLQQIVYSSLCQNITVITYIRTRFLLWEYKTFATVIEWNICNIYHNRVNSSMW